MAAWSGAWPSLAHPLLDALMRFALATPGITRLAALRAVWRVCLALSGGAAALLLTLAGGAVAARGGVGGADARTLAARGAGGVLLATQSLHLVAWSIALCNAAVAAFARDRALAAALSAPEPAGGAVVFLLVLLPYAALLVVLAVVWAIRLVELFVLAALAPLALVCVVHPAAQAVARAWAAEFAAVLLLQPVQVVLLIVFQVAALDLPATGSAPAALVSSLALLYLTLRLPGWLRRVAHSLGQEGAAALWARAVRRALR